MKLHGNARLTPAQRRLLCQRVTEEHWTVADAADAAGISERRAYEWLRRWRSGDRVLEDRSSAPRRVANRTPARVEAVIERLRRLRMTSTAIAAKLQMAVSTVGAVLAIVGAVAVPPAFAGAGSGVNHHGRAHAIYRVATRERMVAMTFDDGPDPRWTPAILQILKEENVKATFCTIGYLAQRHADLVKAEFDAGHSLCDHSMHHMLNLPSRPHPQIVDEVLQAADAIRNITGQNPLFYRPPGGNLNQDIIDTAHQRSLRVLKWSVDPKDYTKPPAPAILARITAKVGPGAVILLHDGGGDRSQTVAMLKQLIEELKHRGFTFYNWQ